MTPPLPYKDVLITTESGKQYVGYYSVWSKKYIDAKTHKPIDNVVAWHHLFKRNYLDNCLWESEG